MVHWKTVGALVAAAALSLLSAAGCSSSGKQSGDASNPASAPAGSGSSSGRSAIKLVGVTSTASEPYYITIMCGATKEAAAEGVTLQWKASANLETSAEQANFNAATLLNPDGLIIATFQPTTFSSQIHTLMSKGTPVVAADGTITPATELKYVGSATQVDDFNALIAKDVGNSGSIGILGGQQGAAWATARWKPLVSDVAHGVKVLPAQYSNLDRAKAASEAAALIVAHPDLKAIYGVTAADGEGAASSVRQAGKQGKIKVYAFGATPDEVAALKAGTIAALISQPAGGIGQTSVQTLVKAIKSHRSGGYAPLPDPTTLLPLKVLTQSNINNPDVQPYVYQTSCKS